MSHGLAGIAQKDMEELGFAGRGNPAHDGPEARPDIIMGITRERI